MQVEVKSDTKQVYNGVSYYMCGSYFQRDGVRLHREVWKDKHGEVPNGFHVHHKDHDRHNNGLDNLELMTKSEHISHHQKGHNRPFPVVALEAAAKWHKSEEGRAWHRDHYEKNKQSLHVKSMRECNQCGKEYEVTGIGKFCSNNCKSKHRKLSGVDNVDRKCDVCHSTFTVNKYAKTVSCSKPCTVILHKRAINSVTGY